jgi:CspA family cold shock protein
MSQLYIKRLSPYLKSNSPTFLVVEKGNNASLICFLKRIYKMAIGTVKWFNTKKGFGFIAPEDGGDDVFVHISAVQKSGIGFLNENDKVSYEIISEKGKKAASNLKKI